jgi:large subunit ribosomal protein L31
VSISLNAGTTIDRSGGENAAGTGESDDSEPDDVEPDDVEPDDDGAGDEGCGDEESGEEESGKEESGTVRPNEYSACYNSSLIRVSKELAMKEGIHPAYQEVEARCACGNTFMTRSTKSELHLEICSACHPFFTGRQKLIDTEGRVERFTKKFGVQTSEQRKAAAKAAKAAKPGARKAAATA